MDSPSRKTWRIQEWRSSGFRAGPVARATITATSPLRRTATEYCCTRRTCFIPCIRWENCEFVDRNFQLRFLVTIRGNACQYGADRERARGGEQPLVAEPASLLLTFSDTPVLQHFSTQR